MFRKFALGVAALAAFAYASDLRADTVTITSDPVWFDIEETPEFYFPDYADVQTDAMLVAAMVEWTFYPGDDQEGTLRLTASLNLEGEVTGLSLDAWVPSGETTDAISLVAASAGLPFGTTLATALDAYSGSLEGDVITSLPNLVAFASFFDAGGEMEGVLHLTWEQDGPGGGGEQVPEPASMLIWGVVGVGALARRRFLAKQTV